MPKPLLLTLDEEKLLLSLMISARDGSFVPSEQPWERIAGQMNQRALTGIRGCYNAEGLKAYWILCLQAKYWVIREADQISVPASTLSTNLAPFQIVEEHAKNINMQAVSETLRPLMTGLGPVQPSGKAFDQFAEATGPPKNFEEACGSKEKGKSQRKEKGKEKA
jgi:hypothetical protein